MLALLLAVGWQAAVHFTHNPPRKSGGSEGVLHVDGAKVRIEEPTPGGTTVVLFDGRKVWLLFPEKKQFVELPKEQAALATVPPLSVADMRAVGTETLGGTACTIYERTVGGIHQRLWVPDKKKFFYFLRQVTQTTLGATKADLTEIRQAPQSAALFRVPPDYQKR